MGFSLELYDIDPATGTYTRKDAIGNFIAPLQFFSTQNGVGGARFQLSGSSAKASNANLIRYRTIVAIKYNSTIIWTGFIKNLTPTFRDVDYFWSIECLDYFGKLTTRITDPVETYAQIGQGSIAWSLIENAQLKTGGFMGFVQGATDDSVLRDRTYNSYEIAEAIMNLSEVINGFYFEVLPVVDGDGLLTSHTFNTYASLGAYRPDIPALTLGSSVLDFTGFTDQEIVNYAIFKGAGTGSNLLTADQEDSGSQVAFSRSDRAYLREDISDTGTLQDWADKTILENKNNYYTLELKLKPNSNLDPFAFRVGDTLNLNLSSPDMTKTFTGTAEVLSKEFWVDSEGVLETKIKVQYIDT